MDHTIMTAINLVLNSLTIVILGFVWWGAKKLIVLMADLQQDIKRIMEVK